jgi:hypothetical protein
MAAQALNDRADSTDNAQPQTSQNAILAAAIAQIAATPTERIPRPTSKPEADPEPTPEADQTPAGIKKERTDGSANRSDYAYHINSKHGKQVLAIEDLDRGGMSVTNNIEAVIAEIADEIGTSIYQMPIVYRDSEGQYDGINGEKLRSDTFYGIGANEERDAVKAAIERRTR